MGKSNFYRLFGGPLLVLTMALMFSGAASAEVVFDKQTPGDYTVDVSTAEEIILESWGASGGDGDVAGAAGGYRKAEFDVTGIDTLYVKVGGRGDDDGSGGFGGGGAGGAQNNAGGGGGLSMAGTSYDVEDSLIVAGGGGGGGATIESDRFDRGKGGAGGDLEAESGADAVAGGATADGGEGGDQSSGGLGGAASGQQLENPGSGGVQGAGGSGGDGEEASGGGGGAGFFGGGGGGAAYDQRRGNRDAAAGGGGGGSNYVDESLLLNDMSNLIGTKNGDGRVLVNVTSEKEKSSENFEETVIFDPSVGSSGEGGGSILERR